MSRGNYNKLGLGITLHPSTKVRALRQAANLSQEELAEACGLQYVCRGCRTRGTQCKPFEYNRSISSIKD